MNVYLNGKLVYRDVYDVDINNYHHNGLARNIDKNGIYFIASVYFNQIEYKNLHIKSCQIVEPDEPVRIGTFKNTYMYKEKPVNLYFFS